MRTALLTALLMTAPLAMGQEDPPPAEGGEEAAGEEGAEEEEEALPEVDQQTKVDACAALGLMENCEVEVPDQEGLILDGLCQLEPCETGWKDGARACKQCVPYQIKPPPEPVPGGARAAGSRDRGGTQEGQATGQEAGLRLRQHRCAARSPGPGPGGPRSSFAAVAERHPPRAPTVRFEGEVPAGEVCDDFGVGAGVQRGLHGREAALPREEHG